MFGPGKVPLTDLSRWVGGPTKFPASGAQVVRRWCAGGAQVGRKWGASGAQGAFRRAERARKRVHEWFRAPKLW